MNKSAGKVSTVENYHKKLPDEIDKEYHTEKKKAVISLMRKVRTEDLNESRILKDASEHNPAMVATLSGRLKRWVKDPYVPVYEKKTLCCATKTKLEE